jgi:hypothetical protein
MGQIGDDRATAIFWPLDVTENSKALKDGPFPLPERERVHFIASYKFANRFEQRIIKRIHGAKVMVSDTMIENPSGNSLFDQNGSGTILIFIDHRIALPLHLEQGA